MSENTKLTLQATLPRTRDLSFVGRFHHNYGFEDNLFEFLLQQKEMWGERLFYMNEKQFANWVDSGKQPIRDIPIINQNAAFPQLQGDSILLSDFKSAFGSGDPIELNVSKGGKSFHKSIKEGESFSLKDITHRNGLAINVGGCITSMKWLHYSSTSYLAITIIGYGENLSELVANKELSVFAALSGLKRELKSAIQLWRYDVDNTSLVLSQVLDTTKFGATSRISWLPAKFSNGILGVLLGVFTDGKLHFFQIGATDSTECTFLRVNESSFSVHVMDERSDGNTTLPITAYDYIDHDRVIVGLVDGSVAEYPLPFQCQRNGEDLSIPSFIFRIADSMVTTVCVANVGAAKVILINTATTQSFALQYDQLRHSRVETNYSISTINPLYHRGFRIFIYPESAESIGYTFVRHPNQKHSLLLKTEVISTFHISEYLNHPFAVMGNACGDVFVLNVGRKIFGVPKAHNKLVVPLKIWSLHKNQESGFTLFGDYAPVAPDRNDVMYTFTPPEVVISASAWNENLHGCSTFAFGTYTGLLVLERLDPGLT